MLRVRGSGRARLRPSRGWRVVFGSDGASPYPEPRPTTPGIPDSCNPASRLRFRCGASFSRTVCSETSVANSPLIDVILTPESPHGVIF
jgi:hypothetical protein